MSLRFNRTAPPKWNARAARIDFVCQDAGARRPVHCAVSRAALEAQNGWEHLDPQHCLDAFARRAARIIEVANSMYVAGRKTRNGSVLVEAEDLA